MTSPGHSPRQTVCHQSQLANFRSVHRLTYEERLFSKIDTRVGIASRSALAALQPSAPQPSALQQSVAPQQTVDSDEQAKQLVAALTELGSLRSEMAALQAALTTLKGDKSVSAMGVVRPRTPTKAALSARASALKKARVDQYHQTEKGSKVQAAQPAVLAPSSSQEQLRQKLIDEPLLEHQEQYKEDPVQPMTREDAETLSRVLNASLPLGSIQAKVNEQWGLRPKGEHPRLVSDLQLLHQDYQLLMTVHGEAVKQASSWCTEEGGVLSGLQQRYTELFGTMLIISDEAQRMYVHMLAGKQQAEKLLKGKEKLAVSLQQQLLKRNEQAEQLRKANESLQGMMESTRESTSTEIAHLLAVAKAIRERNVELAAELEAAQKAHEKELARITQTTTTELQTATRENADLKSRNEYLERQLQKARLRPPRGIVMDDVEVQTDPIQQAAAPAQVIEAPPPPPSPRTPRKKSKVWMGNFVDLFTSKPIPVGRPHSKSWVLKVLGQLWADKIAQDIADPTQNAGKTFCQWVYDWHIHRFGLTNLAEINLSDLIKSVQTCWKQSSKVTHFGQLTAIIQSRNLPRWVAKEDYEFYQMLLSSMATACQPSSVLTLFPDGEVSANVRITPAIETVKAVFKHLEDFEGCREFFATTFENLQDAKAGTLPADPFMQALLDQYLKRITVNRSTLSALFKAADSDSDSLVDRPQYKAAVTVAKPDVTDTVLTTIWLEREKYASNEALNKDATDVEAFVDAARTHGLGMWKIDSRLLGGGQLASPTGWRPPTPSAPLRDTMFKQLAEAAAACRPSLADQVKKMKESLPSSARKDGIALEEQLSHFEQLLGEGDDAEAAYLAEQLLVSQLRYLITMYLTEDVRVTDPFNASALRSSSRPVSPVLTTGGLRGAPLQMQTTDAAARWAAAALRGSFLPGSRGLASGFSGQSMLQGSGASAFAAAAAKVAAMAATTPSADFALPPLPPPARSSLASSDGQKSINPLIF